MSEKFQEVVGGHLAMLVNTTLISIVSHTSQYSFQSFKRLDTSAFSLSQSLVLFFLFFFSQFFLLPLYPFVFFFFFNVLNWDEDNYSGSKKKKLLEKLLFSSDMIKSEEVIIKAIQWEVKKGSKAKDGSAILYWTELCDILGT